MAPLDVFLGALLVFAVGFQIWLTRRVWKSRSFERSQKILQSKVIWLLPVIGAVLVFSMMPEEDEPRRQNTHLKS
jgi:hypothetical protein